MTRIRNIADLAAHVGAAHPTAESIAKRLFKDTRCGVNFSAGNVLAPLRNRPATFTVRWSNSILGWRVLGWRRAHKALSEFQRDMPLALREYLDIDSNGIVAYNPETIEAPEIVKRTVYDGMLWMTVRINEQVSKAKPGILLSGYAEDTDAECPTHTLPFPFTPGQFDALRQQADDEGCELYDATHPDEAAHE